jgi:hypothetical protein
MTDQDKAQYLALEKTAKEKYVKEKEEYDKTATSRVGTSKKSAKGKKRKSANDGPKRAWPPFFFFQAARRATMKEENPDKSHKEIVGMLGKEWRSFTDGEKFVYVEK